MKTLQLPNNWTFETSDDPLLIGVLRHKNYDGYVQVFAECFYVGGEDGNHLPMNEKFLALIQEIQTPEITNDMDALNVTIKIAFEKALKKAQAVEAELLAEFDGNFAYKLGWSAEDAMINEYYRREIERFVNTEVIFHHDNRADLGAQIRNVFEANVRKLLINDPPRSTSDMDTIKYRAERAVCKKMIQFMFYIMSLYRGVFGEDCISKQLKSLLNTI